MTTIRKYLKHTVDIIKVTTARGKKTTSEISDVKAFKSHRSVVVRDTSGDHLATKILLFMLPDANVTSKDKVRVDGIVRPVLKIDKPCFVGRTPNHLEVLLD